MLTKKLDQYWELHVNTRNYTSSAADADSLPTYRVYEEDNDTVIDSGNFAKRDDANTLGYYYARAQITAALGYEVGKTYYVRAAATVNSVSDAEPIGYFTVVPDTVWDALYGGTAYLESNVVQASSGAVTTVASGVWNYTTRELTTAVGLTFNETGSAVWNYTARALTDYASSVLASAIWESGNRTLTSAGGLSFTETGSAVWNYILRSLTENVTATLVSGTTLVASLDSSSLSDMASSVWNYTTGARSLTDYATGSIANAVWENVARTLTTPQGLSFAETGSAVWNYVTRALTEYATGAIASAVWNYSSRTLTSAVGLTFAETGSAVWNYLARTLTDYATGSIADSVLNRTLGGGGSGGRTVASALRFLRNKWAISGTTLTVYAEDDSTPAWTATITSVASAAPVVGTDPA